MNKELVDQIAQAVLYEGHILYPYRPSSSKNRTRFTFGRVYPEPYSVAQNGAEPCIMQTECLAKADAGMARVEVDVRFLQPMAREVGELTVPLSEAPEEPDAKTFRVLPELRVNGKLYQTWQEVVERAIPSGPLALSALVAQPAQNSFAFEKSCKVEPIPGEGGSSSAAMVRRQKAIGGLVEIAAEALDEHLYKIRVRIFNLTPVPVEELESQEAVILRTFASAHTILSIQGGEFLSLTDPPAEYAAAAAACQNTGTWPVLAGNEDERDTLLSSPIILYDYPKVAGESPGDLFDGTEIDEILTLRIQTLTDQEKEEMRNVDEFARRILERTDSLSKDDLLKMHGTMRDVSFPDEDFFNPATRLENVLIGGVLLAKGDRVRICPKGRADVMDMALEGKAAIIESIEQDAEDRVHLALVLESDPGRDLGMMRQPGHRFFYSPEEVEPLSAEEEAG